MLWKWGSYCVKLLGMGLIVLSAAMTGIAMASGLSGRVSGLEAALSLLSSLRDRLCYLRPAMYDLIDGACEQRGLKKNRFLAPCREAMRRGEPFPAAWQAALAAAPGMLGKEELALLSDLGQSLGSSDLASQLDILDCARSRLESLLTEAASRRDKHQRLYSTLGVLSGAVVAILLI